MATDLINNILPSIQHFNASGYWIAFFAALLETTVGIGLLLPGSTIILFLGALAGRGYLDVGDLIWFAVLGAIIGDNINYFFGRRYGERWLQKGAWFLKAKHIEQARSFMNRHGAKSIFLGRFIPSVKEIVPFIAGSVRMNRKTFLCWNILGAIGWGLEWVLAGYIFAQSLNIVELWMSRVGLLLGLIFLFSVFIYFCKWLIIRKGREFFSVLNSLWVSIAEAVRNNDHVIELVHKHPRFFTFLRARLNTSFFSGLPLTILMLALMYVFALSVGIVEDLITSDPIVAADVRIANLLAAFRTPLLTSVFSWITLLGKSQVVLGFIAATVVLSLLWRKHLYILPLCTAVIGSEAFTYLGKIVFHRPRPEVAVYLEHSFSFPSGHATISVSLYGFLAFLFIQSASGWKIRVNLFFSTLLIVLAIGLSRLYLGVHYLSDVWSGYLVGTMWLIIAVSLTEWLEQRNSANQILPPVRAARLLTIGVVAGAAVFYGIFGLRYHPPLASTPPIKTVSVADVTDFFTTQQYKYTESLIGDKQEPLNFIFIAEDDAQLVSVLQQAGWVRTNQANIASLWQTLKTMIMKKPYPAAPISPSFWNAQIQDLSFSRGMGSKMIGNVHHLKIWRSNILSENGGHIYVSMANANTGFKWLVIPKIAADLDTEREFLYSGLQAAGEIQQRQKIQLVKPQTGTNFTGDLFFTDGKAYILTFHKGLQKISD